MAYRYIALLGNAGRGEAKATPDPVQMMLLERAGLQERFSSPNIKLFAHPDTPSLDTACGGVLLGYVFSREGTLINSPAQLPRIGEPAALLAALARDFWGEYLLLQPATALEPETVISRDPSGGVACLYVTDGKTSFVTSDICLAEDIGLYERAIDWDFVSEFLAYTFVKTERTGLRGVRELRPGTSLHVPAQGTTIAKAYWNPWNFVCPGHYEPAFEDAADSVRRVVEMVISSWGQVDRSILLELSGGLDSSIIASCLRQTSSRVVCVTLVSALPGADERQYATAIAERSGLRLRSEGLTIDRSRIDTPVPRQCVTPRAGPLQHAADEIMREVAQEEGLQAFYSGGGGDTVFSYLTNASPAADAFVKGRPFSGLKAVSNLADLHQCTLWKAARLTAKKIRAREAKSTAADLSFLAPGFAFDAPAPHPWALAASQHAPGDAERVLGLIGTQTFRDGLPRGTLNRLRLPLLSQPVMETCLAIPSWMWIANGVNRSVARAAFSDVLPTNVALRKSKGDFIQYCAAVYRHNKDSIQEMLLDGELASRGLLNSDELRDFFDRPPSARDETFMRIFDFCTIESWLRQQP